MALRMGRHFNAGRISEVMHKLLQVNQLEAGKSSLASGPLSQPEGRWFESNPRYHLKRLRTKYLQLLLSRFFFGRNGFCGTFVEVFFHTPVRPRNRPTLPPARSGLTALIAHYLESAASF